LLRGDSYAFEFNPIEQKCKQQAKKVFQLTNGKKQRNSPVLEVESSRVAQRLP
jgi:hypothetical protein